MRHFLFLFCVPQNRYRKIGFFSLVQNLPLLIIDLHISIDIHTSITMLRQIIRTMSTSSTSTEAGPIHQLIQQRITQAFNPQVLDIKNDSHKHTHHQAMRGASNTIESHFRLSIVSNEFQGKNQPARHRMVYSLLKDEMSRENGIHALQLTTKTPEEWEKVNSK